MALIIPLTAGGVFFYLQWSEKQEQTTEEASEAPEVEVKSTIQKNPNKKRAADGSPLPSPVVPKVEVSDVYYVKEAPFSLGAADSSYRLPNEKFLKPVIELSTGSPTEGDLPRVDPSQPSIELSREELSILTKWIAKDPSAKAIADQWKIESRAAVGIGVNPVAQFRWNTPEERAASETARNELKTIRIMVSSLLAWGEQDVAEQLHQSILAWATMYRPLGDVYSDAELVPILHAYASVWRKFRPEEQKQMDQWLRLLADRQITEAVQRPLRTDRWFAYHMQMGTLVGFATGNAALQNYVKRNFPVHLAGAFKGDGSTTTLEQTGSMALHIDHLNRLLEATIVMYRVGRVVPETMPTANSNYGRAVAFTGPYALGFKQWNEFEKPADANLVKRQALGDVALGVKPFIWRTDTSFLESLAFFRLPHRLGDIAQSFGTPQARFPTPRSLIVDSMIRDVDWLSPPMAPQQAPQSAPPSVPMPASVK